MYVVEINEADNTVVLGEGDEVFSNTLTASDLNFIALDQLKSSMKVKAKIRYSAKAADAEIRPGANGNVEVCFEAPQRAVTPGQAVVFYKEDIVLGGGIIEG